MLCASVCQDINIDTAQSLDAKIPYTDNKYEATAGAGLVERAGVIVGEVVCGGVLVVGVTFLALVS